MTTYRVRQHIPDFVSGYDPEEIADVDRADIANPDKIPWMKRFEHEGFVEFTTKPYVQGSFIISASYADGKSWVVSVARPNP